jgi:predicted peroxiredoxin
MAKLLFMGLHGSADPTTAAFPFIMANGAVEAGHEPTVVLANEAVVLMSGTVADNMHGVGWPPFSEILGKTIENQVPIYV